MVKKIIGALGIGLGLAMLLIERDPCACARIGDAFKDFFSTTYACSLTADIEQITLFSPSLTLHDVVVRPRDGRSWQWCAARLTIGFSWFQFLIYGVVNLYVHLDGVTLRATSKEDVYGLRDHFISMMTTGSSLVLSRMDEIRISDADISFMNNDNTSAMHLRMRYAMRRISGVERSSVTLLDGSLTHIKKIIFKQLSGTVQIDTQYDTQHTYTDIQTECACTLPWLPFDQRTCFVRGDWRTGSGNFSLFNADRTLVADGIKAITTKAGVSVDAQVQTTCSQLAAAAGYEHAELVGGTVSCDTHVDVHNDACTIQADLVATNCTYADTLLASSCHITGKKVGDECAGTISLACPDTLECTGTLSYLCSTGIGKLQMHNTTPYRLPTTALWRCAPGACMITMMCDAAGKNTGTYQCTAEHVTKKNEITLDGNITLDATQATVTGTCADMSYRAEFFANPNWQLRFMRGINKVGEPLITVRSLPRNPKHIKAVVDVASIRTLLATLYDYDIQGAGLMTFDAHLGPISTVDMRLAKGTIRTDHMYNVINGARAHIVYDTKTRTLTATDVTCSLHKGVIRLNRAVIQYDENGRLFHWYLPFTLKNCLVNYKHMFFAHLSGHLTASYTAGNMPHVAGALLLDRSHIKENIFSDQLQKHIADLTELTLVSTGPDVACDIRVETVIPLHVQTPFLEADAQMSFHLGNTARDPHVSGTLNILSGSLLFPYRPLHITKGVVTITSQQSSDPLIELVAQNHVRNHAISMHVTGSLLQHHLMFESTPPLTEEQIIALLLVGSEEESLNIVMPTLIMQNLASLVFGGDTSATTLERYFKKWLQPFKGIHIVPRFSDQSSRGGLRGAIDIEVNDRWHALIQKNFNLTEDTRFEVEYQVSDDIRLRAIRDEHRDMGAEVEMRWKF